MTLRVFAIVLLAVPAWAQTGAANGSIRGLVHDPNQAAVANAEVSARNVDTGFERRAVTNSEGEFEVPLLPLGRYRVTLAVPGFAAYQQNGIVVTPRALQQPRYRFAARLYTLGYAFNTNDSTGDTGSPVTDSTNLKRDYGLSSSDQRHRFVLQGVWQPHAPLTGFAGQAANGWLVAPNVTWTSGFPINAVAGSDLNGDSINNDRPLFRGRNDTPGYGFQEVNLRVSRTFELRERLSLEIIAEAENLFNSLNVACTTGGCTGAVVNNANAADFRRITVATDSRQIQLGARIRF